MACILHFKDYADDIHLYDEFSPARGSNQSIEQIVDDLLSELEERALPGLSYPHKRQLLHAKINTLPPNFFGAEAIAKLDCLLQSELENKDITDSAALSGGLGRTIEGTRVVVWQGDIATVKIDAVVNAANNRLLGCFQPLHSCIDNVIHSAAGVQLRDDCDIIMQKQKFPEPTGTAKITRAYNLPSRFILHTVGPIVRGEVTKKNETDLVHSYTSCLDICRSVPAIRSIAFSCISTGVFGYPGPKAAVVAYETVIDWLGKHPNALDLVLFDVFTEEDRILYNSLNGAEDGYQDNSQV